MTASTFFTQPIHHQWALYRWQQVNREKMARMFPEGPPFWLAIPKPGDPDPLPRATVLLYPVLPDGERVEAA